MASGEMAEGGVMEGFLGEMHGMRAQYETRIRRLEKLVEDIGTDRVELRALLRRCAEKVAEMQWADGGPGPMGPFCYGCLVELGKPHLDTCEIEPLLADIREALGEGGERAYRRPPALSPEERMRRRGPSVAERLGEGGETAQPRTALLSDEEREALGEGSDG
ncbi:MAG: hypothetical protein B7733_06255 [Myxococcales bacterium FL481]|nr:MAG: hypothetical protein B7733_06255 [Myxococcales bacterium FL481]